jgi:hypothetical protein
LFLAVFCCSNPGTGFPSLRADSDISLSRQRIDSRRIIPHTDPDISFLASPFFVSPYQTLSFHANTFPMITCCKTVNRYRGTCMLSPEIRSSRRIPQHSLLRIIIVYYKRKARPENCLLA